MLGYRQEKKKNNFEDIALKIFLLIVLTMIDVYRIYVYSQITVLFFFPLKINSLL